MLILGSSDTSGTVLADAGGVWPNLVAAELGARVGEPIEVTDVLIVPVGPKAVPRAEAALEKTNPDIVVFAFGAFHFVVGTVGQRVRRRYGERTYRLFRRLEVRFERVTANSEGRRARINRAGRRLARFVIGAEPLSTEEEVTGIELEIINKLSQREHLIVVIMCAPPLGAEIERENRGANKRLAKLRDFMNATARSHHFLVADCVPGFVNAEEQGRLRHSDGVHKSLAGHRIQADAIMQALLTAPSPLATEAAAPTPVAVG